MEKEVYYHLTLKQLYEKVNKNHELDNRWNWSESTRLEYRRHYIKLGEHLSDRPFLDYDLDGIEAALTAIKKEGYYRDKKTVNRPYDEKTINKYRANLHSLYQFLYEKGIVKQSLYWGSEDKIDSTLTEEDLSVRENILLPRSLTPASERNIFNEVMLDPEQDGENLGIALMFSLGLRNGEACGARFIDVIKLDGPEDFYALRVTHTVRDDLELGGKTKNSFRLIPIPNILKTLIDKRLEYIRHSSFYLKRCNRKDFDIMKLPISCRGQIFNNICKTSHLSIAGKALLKKANYDENVLKLIATRIKRDYELEEKEATAYLFRRNFATMMQILGLSQSEIEYIIGHNIESDYETRNYYSNPDKLYPIKLKMDNRPLFSSHYSLDAVIEAHPETVVHFDNPYEQNIRIPKEVGVGTIVIDFQATAPGAEVKIIVKSSDDNPTIPYELIGSMKKRDKYDRTTSVLKTVHQVYDSKKKNQTNTTN